jgi:hypothetical protein
MRSMGSVRRGSRRMGKSAGEAARTGGRFGDGQVGLTREPVRKAGRDPPTDRTRSRIEEDNHVGSILRPCRVSLTGGTSSVGVKCSLDQGRAVRSPINAGRIPATVVDASIKVIPNAGRPRPAVRRYGVSHSTSGSQRWRSGKRPRIAWEPLARPRRRRKRIARRAAIASQVMATP